MRKKLALEVEWAWLNGELLGAHEVDTFAASFAEKYLFSRYPKNMQGDFFKGAQEIQKDTLQILRVLRYGGRSRKDVPQERLEAVKARLAA